MGPNYTDKNQFPDFDVTEFTENTDIDHVSRAALGADSPDCDYREGLYYLNLSGFQPKLPEGYNQHDLGESLSLGVDGAELGCDLSAFEISAAEEREVFLGILQGNISWLEEIGSADPEELSSFHEDEFEDVQDRVSRQVFFRVVNHPELGRLYHFIVNDSTVDIIDFSAHVQIVEFIMSMSDGIITKQTSESVKNNHDRDWRYLPDTGPVLKKKVSDDNGRAALTIKRGDNYRSSLPAPFILGGTLSDLERQRAYAKELASLTNRLDRDRTYKPNVQRTKSNR